MSIGISTILSNSTVFSTMPQEGGKLLNNVDKKVYAFAVVCFALLVASLAFIYRLYRSINAQEEKIKALELAAKGEKAPTELSNEEKIAAKKEKLLEQNKEAESLIMDLFGGKENFEKLPELAKKDRGDFIYVNKAELTAPIMRGKATDNRLFFTIRFKDPDGEVMHQTFSSRYPDKGYWLSTGDNIIGELIHYDENYKSVKQPAYETLKTLIETKKMQIEWGYNYQLRTYELF